FLMPIIGLIIVGVVAYNRAEKGLSENYISSTTQTVEMAKEYIDQGCNYVNAETIKFCSNSDLQQLMLGLFANDQVSALNITSTVKTDMNASIVANELINAIHIIPKSNFNVISSKTTSTQTGFMNEYLDSMGADKYSIPRWVDNHAFLDERINTSPDNYILSNQIMAGNSTYAVVIDVDAKAVKKFLDGLDLGEDSVVGLVTEGGRELMSDNYGVLPEAEEGKYVFVGQDYYENSKSEKSGVQEIHYADKDFYYIFSRSSVSGAAVCALVPISTVTGQAGSIRTLTYTIVIIATALALLIGLFIAAGIMGNMKRISGKLEEVAKGDLTVTVNAKGHDEFNDLAGSATHMVKNTKKLVNKVSDATIELENSAVKVVDVSRLIDEHSQEINESIDEINRGMERQSRHAQECVEKTDTLSNEIHEISQLVDEVEKMVNETELMIKEGMDIVRNLGQRAEETTDITKAVGESIDSLKEESAIINTFVSTISDIAEQTNLLSLNASIEAARAGEAGRGFAVVAEEIRKLADDSASAAAEIGRNVLNISSQTMKSVESANEAQNMVKLQSEAVVQATEVFRNMEERMTNLVGGLKSIVDGIERADKERGETVSAVKRISEIIDETSQNAEAVHEVADRLLSNVEDLNSTADVLNERMGELKTEVSVFKIEKQN
ncbi:MAG: methyl-accepting chemotaxis protein, partial [Lachnospiraceae bacterium]|nr:methyl-accepting chemotaxis protein [Lachnospiraceae bacterium]